MSDVFGASNFLPEDHRLCRLRMRNGGYQIRIEPPIPEGKTAYKWTDSEVQVIAGYHGITCPEEIDVRIDYSRATACARCGDPGVDNHHWAPRYIFEDADEWPQEDLCRPCHREWHARLEDYFAETYHQALAFRDWCAKQVGGWDGLFDIWADTKDLNQRERWAVREAIKALRERRRPGGTGEEGETG